MYSCIYKIYTFILTIFEEIKHFYIAHWIAYFYLYIIRFSFCHLYVDITFSNMHMNKNPFLGAYCIHTRIKIYIMQSLTVIHMYVMYVYVQYIYTTNAYVRRICMYVCIKFIVYEFIWECLFFHKDKY